MWAVKVSSTKTNEVGKQHNVILRATERKHECGTYPFLLPAIFSDVLILLKYKGDVAKSYRVC